MDKPFNCHHFLSQGEIWSCGVGVLGEGGAEGWGTAGIGKPAGEWCCGAFSGEQGSPELHHETGPKAVALDSMLLVKGMNGAAKR